MIVHLNGALNVCDRTAPADRLTRLSLAPELGASLVNWEVKATGQALLRHSDLAALESGTPRRLACYPLAPWSNRIGEGGFCPTRGVAGTGTQYGA